MNKIFTILLSIMFMHGYAQDSIKTNPFTLSGYVDVYYSYDFSNPVSHERPSFFYSYNRHNETNLNLAFIKANYATDKIRGNLALMAGTYAQYNLAGEQGLLRNIFEANVGVRISKKNNIWVDAGIMPAHIGFESAVGKDCWNLTRSILAENSPYYEAGEKVSYTSKNDKLYVAMMYLNGWQRIQRLPSNQTPAFGSQLTFKSNSKVILNWSTYAGNEQPNSAKAWRYFNNFYAQVLLSERWGLITGFDIGSQQKDANSGSYNTWYSPVVIIRYIATDKIRLATRGEYYRDKNGVIISTGTPQGFQTYGYSLNFDYLPASNVMVRIEGRNLTSKDKIFGGENDKTLSNYFVTTSLAISF